MINKISGNISSWLTDNYPNEMPSFNKVNYSIKILLTNMLPLILIATLSQLVFNEAINSLKALIAFAVLRQFSGGYHLKNADMCVVASTTMIILISHFNYLFSIYINLLNILSLILCLIYSPSNITGNTRVKSKYFFVFKIISVLIVFLAFFLKDTTISLSFFIQSILLIRIPRKVVKNNDEK